MAERKPFAFKCGDSKTDELISDDAYEMSFSVFGIPIIFTCTNSRRDAEQLAEDIDEILHVRMNVRIWSESEDGDPEGNVYFLTFHNVIGQHLRDTVRTFSIAWKLGKSSASRQWARMNLE